MLLSPQGTAAVARVILSFWSQTWSRWSLKKHLEKSSFWSDTAAHFLELVSPEQGSFTPSNARIPTPLTISLLNRRITQPPAIMWVCHLQGLSEQGFEDPWMYVWWGLGILTNQCLVGEVRNLGKLWLAALGWFAMLGGVWQTHEKRNQQPLEKLGSEVKGEMEKV